MARTIATERKRRRKNRLNTRKDVALEQQPPSSHTKANAAVNTSASSTQESSIARADPECPALEQNSANSGGVSQNVPALDQKQSSSAESSASTEESELDQAEDSCAESHSEQESPESESEENVNQAGDRAIQDLIRKATSRSLEEVPVDVLRCITREARKSHENLQCIFSGLMERLRARHSKTRILAASVMNVLFLRSKMFRELSMEKLSEIFELTLGLTEALPAPQYLQSYLSTGSMAMFDAWATRYGSDLPHLRRGMRYLTGPCQLQVPSDEQCKRLQQLPARPPSPTRLQRKLNAKTRVESVQIARNHIYAANSYVATWWDLDHHSW